MSNPPITLTQQDYEKLRLLVSSLESHPRGKALVASLHTELGRAQVLGEGASLPPGVVTMNSEVHIQDIESGEIDIYTLVFPEHADAERRRLSILAPIGTAILGYREGDEITWHTPGGARRIKLLKVITPEKIGVSP